MKNFLKEKLLNCLHVYLAGSMDVVSNDEENQIRSSLRILTHLGKWRRNRYWWKGAFLHRPERAVLIGKGRTRRPSWILACGYVDRDSAAKKDY